MHTAIYGRFAPLSVRPLDDSPPRRFAPWTFRTQDVSPSGHFATTQWTIRPLSGNQKTLNLFSVNIHVHQKPRSAIFREGIRLGLVYGVRVSFRSNQ